jgi:hypothetical protein
MSRETPPPSGRRDETPIERPTHPTRQAVLLLVAVTLLIVLLAALSSWGTI